ncbi:MAG: choice-of-anchor D domain-containing protein [Calditrichaeota bacterium]|nr:choice-of-anchor D domain-containing protein [Calditrichota bacterium]
MRYLQISILIFLIALTPKVTDARIIHVPDDRETIQDAIDAASRDAIDTVLVQPGVYNETINDVTGREIVVGSLYLTTREDHFINETIIDANGDGRVLTFQNGEGRETKWVGFTITGGSRTYGAGVYCLGTSPTFSNMVIFGNTAIRPEDSGGYGGGFYITTRAGNEDEVAEPLLVNCTIYGNHGEGGRGGIHIYRNGDPTLINCVHWNNTHGEDNEISIVAPDHNITYSDIQDGYEGQGNIDRDPELMDPDEGEFNLTEGSPCVDSGDPESPRDIDDTRADMGALIFAQSPSIFVDQRELDFGAVNVGQSIQQTVRVSSRSVVTLVIDEIILLPDDVPFEIIEGGEPVELEDGERIDIVIQFAPENEGDYEAVLMILNNDPNLNEVEIGMIGIGFPPQPDIEIEPNFFIFGEVPLRTISERVLTISNVGAEVLNVSSIGIIGEDAEQFSTDVDGEFDIEQNGSVDVTVYFEPKDISEFSADIMIENSSPDEEVIEIRVTGTGILPEMHYEFVDNTGQNHSILVVEATLNDEPLAVGSEIGVFSPDGMCCGAQFWTGERVGMAVWGDNDLTEEIDGLVEDEEMSFQIWDIASGSEYATEARFIQGNNVFHDGGVSVLTLSSGGEPQGDEFNLELVESWNMVSTPIIPEDDDIIGLWGGLGEADLLQLLKNSVGQFYSPLFGFNNIPGWDFRYGYQAKMSAGAELMFEGEFAPVQTQIPLQVGWKIVAYLPEDPQRAAVSFENIVDLLEIAKDGMGRFYLPAFGFDNMGNLVRGQGYQIQLTEETELIWNVGEQGQAANLLPTDKAKYFIAPEPTGRNMSFLITESPNLDDDVEIAAFSEDNICVGSTVLSGEGPWGMAIWGDDPGTSDIEGAIEGDELNFVMRQHGHNTDIEPSWIVGNSTFNTDTYAVASVPVDALLPVEFVFEAPYPNPFNSSTTIKFSLPESENVDLMVHDLAGREVISLVQGSFEAGHHSLSLKADGLSSGIYILSFKAGETSASAKLMLLR